MVFEITAFIRIDPGSVPDQEYITVTGTSDESYWECARRDFYSIVRFVEINNTPIEKYCELHQLRY